MTSSVLPSSANHPGQAVPRVFIGLPVYNGARFLAEALDSLLSQTFRDFVLFISDNASTDNTEQICAEYAARDERIRYFRQPVNIGAPRNWNFVADQARGEYFKWATSNDICHQDMLAACVAALDADPQAVLSQGRTILVDEDTEAQTEYHHDLALPGRLPSQRLRQLLLELALNNGQTGLIRLSELRKTRLDRLYPDGDIAFMAELALLGKFVVLPQFLLYRRMGSSTFTCLLRGDAIGEFFGKQAMESWIGHRLRLHLDIVRAALTMPIPLSERWTSLGCALRFMAWNRHRIWNELVQAFSFSR